MISDESRRWIEASNIIGNNPDAIVICPKCGKADLDVLDIRSESDSTHLERVMQCPQCGAKNYMRLHRPIIKS